MNALLYRARALSWGLLALPLFPLMVAMVFPLANLWTLARETYGSKQYRLFVGGLGFWNVWWTYYSSDVFFLRRQIAHAIRKGLG